MSMQELLARGARVMMNNVSRLPAVLPAVKVLISMMPTAKVS